MSGTGTQTDEEVAIPCPAIVGGVIGGCGVFACVVCEHLCCKLHEMDDGWTSEGPKEPVHLPLCSLYCLAQLDGNHRRVRGLPDPHQVIHTRIGGEDVTNWRIENGDGIVFMEDGVEYIFLTEYRENSGNGYIPRVCITLAVLMEILAKQ
jgi:hypothetical protein